MGFPLCTSRFFVGVLLAGFGLAGCTGMTGSISRAWTINGKCSAMQDWVEQFEKEFPLRSIGLYGGQSPATIANLYRVEVFEPVFGFSYEKTYEAEINDITQDVLPYCSGEKNGVRPEILQAFQPLKKLVDAGFPFRAELASLAKERTEREAWRKKALLEISEVPTTPAGFKNIENYYLGYGGKEVSDLWTSDKNEYLGKVKARRGEIAEVLLADFIPDPEMLTNSLISVRKVQDAEVYLVALEESSDDRLRAVTEKYHARKRAIMAHLVRQQIIVLRKIPHNHDGFRLSQTWMEDFERTFLPFSDMDEVLEGHRAFLEKRQAIFEANRKMIYNRFTFLGFGNSARQKEQALLAETFPLPSDYHLAFYREFRSHYRNKGDSAVLDLLDKSKKAVVDYYETISGFAKDMLYGKPE